MPSVQEHGSQVAMLRRPIVVEETMAAGVTRARVKCECRLDWYWQRALIVDRQHQAGIKFRADWLLGSQEPRVTGSYGQSIAGSEHFSVAQLAARRRVNKAVEAIRGRLWLYALIDVCAVDMWPKSGVNILREALDDLADHYGLEKTVA